MRVILQVTSGPSQGRRIPIQSGESARFGRSDIADVCFPDDELMSDVHFELECQSDQCLVRDVGGMGGTLVNEQPVSVVAIGNGDLILAGQTRLLTSVEGQLIDASAVDSAADEQETEDPKLTATELCTLTELEEESLELFRPKHSPEEFVRVLTEHNQYADAIRILSLYLPKRKAILWAHEAVKAASDREISTDERAALDAAMTWLKESSEENRRAAMALAEAAEFSTAASCVAASAFWSEGSMAPPDLPEVPPGEHLCAQGVTAALLMAAQVGDVEKTEERFTRILKIGQEVLVGDMKLPEA